MNIKKIVRYLELKSQLTTEELQMAETMVGLTESDKEALAGLLQPVKASKPATKRVIEKCATEGCSLTRRARIHHDRDTVDYHEFQPPQSSSKSKRASGMARALNDSLKSRQSKEPRCIVCYEIAAHSNHDTSDGGHEFTTDLAKRVIEQLAGREYCVAMVDDNGGEVACGKEADDNIHHLQKHPDYHEFVASETAVGVGGG